MKTQLKSEVKIIVSHIFRKIKAKPIQSIDRDAIEIGSKNYRTLYFS